MIKKGRQIGKRLSEIRDDHRRRYEAAAVFARKCGHRIISDVGSGAGYGSYILATHGYEPGDLQRIVRAYEIDPDANMFAEEHWRHPNILRETLDLTKKTDWPPTGLLVAFEILEHITRDEAVAFLQAVKAQHIIASVPNEDVIPFAEATHREHKRHYTGPQFEALLHDGGFILMSAGGQIGKREQQGEIKWTGFQGRTLVAKARRVRL